MELSLDRIGRGRAVLIAGATASGKSAAAIRLAEEAARRGRSAWIVNADSMQVYDALRVLTARPGVADERRVPHRLYGHASVGTRYSVGTWLREIAPILEEAEAAEALVIAVGGTGLYFKALTEGLASIPPIPADVRNKWTERLRQHGAASLHEELRRTDPAAAVTIQAGDPQRIVRALEVLEATGRPLGEWQKIRAALPLLPPGDTARFVVEVPRAVLHQRIGERVDRMVDQGALEEVGTLVARRLDPDLPAMKAIGVRSFAAFLRQEIPLDEAIAEANQETRRYAKRQATWFRHQMRDWARIAG